MLVNSLNEVDKYNKYTKDLPIIWVKFRSFEVLAAQPKISYPYPWDSISRTERSNNNKWKNRFIFVQFCVKIYCKNE